MSQSFVDGNLCDLTEQGNGGDGSQADSSTSTGSGAGSRSLVITRETELRYLCSPDSDMHLVVKEPSQCVYQIDLYVPALCEVEGFRPQAGGRSTAGGAVSTSSGGMGSGPGAHSSSSVDEEDEGEGSYETDADDGEEASVPPAHEEL